MRPSYDGEHPTAPTPTPIYDELYSEYRRLFRALPGDRAGEEDLRFTGFAVRERPYAGLLEEYRDAYGNRPGYGPGLGGDYFAVRGALTQHQALPGQPGQPGQPAGPAGAPGTAGTTGAAQFVPAQQQVPHQPYPAPHGGQQEQTQLLHPQAPAHQQPAQNQQQNPPQGQHHTQQQPHQNQHQAAHQQPQAHPQHQQASVPHGSIPPPSTGQGWVATGYLAPPAVPAPTAAPVVPAPAGAAPGRHRNNLLSLPPGRG
ncbi:hypothetical protein [Kitasatospora nipponensis]